MSGVGQCPGAGTGRVLGAGTELAGLLQSLSQNIVTKPYNPPPSPHASLGPAWTQLEQGHASRNEQKVERSRWLDDGSRDPLQVVLLAGFSCHQKP